MAAKSEVILLAAMNDGTEHRVAVDQRDFAAWEAHSGADESMPHTRLRFLVHNAMTRQQLTTAKWPEFNQLLLVDASGDESPE